MTAQRLNRVSRLEPMLSWTGAGLNKGDVGSREPEGWGASRFWWYNRTSLPSQDTCLYSQASLAIRLEYELVAVKPEVS